MPSRFRTLGYKHPYVSLSHNFSNNRFQPGLNPAPPAPTPSGDIVINCYINIATGIFTNMRGALMGQPSNNFVPTDALYSHNSVLLELYNELDDSVIGTTAIVWDSMPTILSYPQPYTITTKNLGRQYFHILSAGESGTEIRFNYATQNDGGTPNDPVDTLYYIGATNFESVVQDTLRPVFVKLLFPNDPNPYITPGGTPIYNMGLDKQHFQITIKAPI